MSDEIEQSRLETDLSNALTGAPAEADVLKWLLSKLITARVEVAARQIRDRFEDSYRHRIIQLNEEALNARKIAERKLSQRLSAMASDARQRGDEELRGKLQKAAKALFSDDENIANNNMTTP